MTLRESAEVAARLAREACLRDHDQVAERLEQRAQERRRHLVALRELLVRAVSRITQPAGNPRRTAVATIGHTDFLKVRAMEV